MSDSPYQVPERIAEGGQKFLNCKVGESVRPESEDDQFVLNRLEAVCGGSFLQLYYKYPDVGPNEEQEYIDVVGLTTNYGVVVIDILPLSFESIENIRGPDWYLEDESQPIRPLSDCTDAGIGIERIFEDTPECRDEDRNSIIPVNHYVALPSINKEEWEESIDIDDDRLIFRDVLDDREKLHELLLPAEDFEPEDIDIRNALAALRFSENISGGQLNVAVQPESKRELLDFNKRRLKILTEQQMKIGLQSPDNPQQLRGIAGSGKTVVSALRAAKLHKDDSDMDIAVTFRTHGLHQIHKDLISSFYATLSGGDEPNWEKLRVLNAWGGSSVGEGMYSMIAGKADKNSLSATQARNKFGKFLSVPKLLDKCCKELYNSGEIPEFFDAIIIDEAQDLPTYFFRMCYEAAKENKRIYWAYDEAQNLATLEAQTAKNLFGTDDDGNPLVDISGNLENQVSGTHVMRKSFRTPRSVLMTAYGFGMGLYRNGPLIQTITNQRGWDYLGYEIDEIDGDFRTEGSRVVIKRPIENSPHPLWQRQEPNELVKIRWEDSWEEEIDWVAQDIKSLIEDENVLPSEILITYLWPYEIRDERVAYLTEELENEFSEDEVGVHNVRSAVKEKGSNVDFKIEGKITLADVHYVGGNESGIVYVMGTQHAGMEATQERYTDAAWRQNHVEARNMAFIAMTRTQGWCRITGADPTHRIAGELNRVVADTLTEDPQLEFEVPPDDSPYKNMEPEAYE